MKIISARDISAVLAKGLEEDGLVLSEEDLSPAFFGLKSGLAGELLQKFVNYGVPLAVVVKDPSVHGRRFEELARELQSHSMVRIFPALDSAVEWLDAQRQLR